jgi:hypothetical protein
MGKHVVSKRIIMVSFVGFALAAGIAFAQNRVFAKRVFTDEIVNTNVVYSASIKASDYRPMGNFAAEIRLAGGMLQTGTGTVDYVKVQYSTDDSTWYDGPTIMDDVAIATTNATSSSYTNLTGQLAIAPFYRLATLVKDTETVGTGTGVVVNAWIVIH